MKAYSNDLRRKIVESYENNDYSQDEVAELFGVSLATVKNFLRRKRETGSTDALPHAGGQQPLLDEKARKFVQHLISEQNDLTLEELCQCVERKYKQNVSLPTMSRLLQALGLPRKKRRSTPVKGIHPESSEHAVTTSKR
jgi:transposase